MAIRNRLTVLQFDMILQIRYIFHNNINTVTNYLLGILISDAIVAAKVLLEVITVVEEFEVVVNIVVTSN